MHDDIFDDLEQIQVEVMPGTITAKKRERRRQQFVKVPLSWIKILSGVRRASTLRVTLYLLYRHWKDGGKSITLSNIVLAEWGLTKWQKWRALAELERLGLVEVVRKPRQAPVVTLSITNLET